MTLARPIAVVGSGPILAIARSLAAELVGDGRVIAVELPPDRIAGADARTLIGRAPGEIEAFAAVGLHALNHARADLCAKLLEAGYSLATLVHPRAIVDRSASLESNVLVCGGAGVGPGASIGSGVTILDGARIEAGARIGPFAWIGANVAVGFGASVGAHTILRPGVHLDAAVPVGDHCELATPGLRQAAIPACTFDTPAFDRPVRIFRGRESAKGASA